MPSGLHFIEKGSVMIKYTQIESGRRKVVELRAGNRPILQSNIREDFAAEM